MATRKKSTTELAPQSDPKAPLESAALLKAAIPLLKRLAADLLGRADGSATLRAALENRHKQDQAAELTADNFDTWRRDFAEQVAAAWFLSCVFVRTLEDRGLVEQHRLGGPGAEDSQRAFFALCPSLSERDYLLTVFRELGHLPAAEALFDARHNPVWLFGPSAELSQELLAFFRAPEAAAPAFRFGNEDTRFLGDLYQDLSENVRKRFALLQTPRFVESFILDQTLDRAIERFGLSEATLIDPTCGSGHFLLGAFERLFNRRLQAAPGTDVRQAAQEALAAVAGCDINPYAVAIARFRLTLAFLEKAGYERLRGAPKLPLNVVVADSLLHNPRAAQQELGDLPGVNVEVWKGSEFRLEDPGAARAVLRREYAAVVGNPPYITVKDAALRERYRGMYSRSAAGKYSLAAPFCECFFQLGRRGAHVGMITANSFMKREFGKKLIEQYLPSVNLETVINTSGAYIPGHGTPTVLLFGTAEKAQKTKVLTVLASRGEPSTPEDPEKGLVWSSVAGHWNEVGFENEYISVTETEREALGKHPWSLGGGGATELKELLEERAQSRLVDVVDVIGFGGILGEDDIYVLPRGSAQRWGLPADAVAELAIGEELRDWGLSTNQDVVVPYGRTSTHALEHLGRYGRLLWCFKGILSAVRGKGFKTKSEAGRPYYEYAMFYRDRFFAPMKIAFAFVATHNHFVLDRGGKVFNRSAPIIKLPEGATEDDHYALLAYLNSSTACFWMKQVFYPKATSVGDISVEKGKPEANRYEFAGTGLQALPLPPWSEPERTELATLAREASELAKRKADLSARRVLVAEEANTWAAACEQRTALSERLLVVQEDIDWLVYKIFGFVPGRISSETLAAPERDPPPHSGGAGGLDARLSRRTPGLREVKELRVFEDAMYKRQWLGRQGVFGHGTQSLGEEVVASLVQLVQDEAEEALASSLQVKALRDLRGAVASARPLLRALGVAQYDIDPAACARQALARLDAVPFLCSMRFTPSGLEKHAAWQRTWELQRREDAGETVGNIPVPPKYAQDDFRNPSFWSLRGKLDVPKERFISYPGCESDEDGEPVYGWAGWDHLQRAQALAALYNARREEGWAQEDKKERLKPMLAGLLELLPWLIQWHNDSNDELGGARPGEQFALFLEAQCTELGFTQDELRAWRPEGKKGGGKRVAAPKKAPEQRDAAKRGPSKKRGAKASGTDPASED